MHSDGSLHKLMMGQLLTQTRYFAIAVLCIALSPPSSGLAQGDFSSSAPPSMRQESVNGTPPGRGSERLNAGSERIEERHNMVRVQLEQPVDLRAPITNSAVLRAMRDAPRHVFVPSHFTDHAYADLPLGIGFGQTISQPYMVGLMTELLEVTPQSRVLEIGTGSGYQAAVLAQLTAHVYTVEILKELADRARASLQTLGYNTVKVRHGDGYYGWPEESPFDAIIVTCAAGHLPAPLWNQLRPGGRIVIPIGAAYEVQRLVVLTKTPDGKRLSRTVTDVRFVPLVRNLQE